MKLTPYQREAAKLIVAGVTAQLTALLGQHSAVALVFAPEQGVLDGLTKDGTPEPPYTVTNDNVEPGAVASLLTAASNHLRELQADRDRAQMNAFMEAMMRGIADAMGGVVTPEGVIRRPATARRTVTIRPAGRLVFPALSAPKFPDPAADAVEDAEELPPICPDCGERHD